jgi:hypothetical protein
MINVWYLFLTIILCPYLIFPFTQHELHSLKCSEEDFLADFFLKKDARLNNPGACSLEFQSVMLILTEHMLKWDTETKTSTWKGILGTVRAFASTDEEQGQKTLHQHWQNWVEKIDQTLRNSLFGNDHKTRNKARQTFQQHIDNVVWILGEFHWCKKYELKVINLY